MFGLHALLTPLTLHLVNLEKITCSTQVKDCRMNAVNTNVDSHYISTVINFIYARCRKHRSKVNFMYLEKCWSHVREVEGLSAQAGQYLRRLYEACFL